MGGRASQNLQAMAPSALMQYTVAIATPLLCPDHRSTSTDQVRGEQMNLSWVFLLTCALFHHLLLSPSIPAVGS